MYLPNHFNFSQGSLQDFCDCQRRFELRYVNNLDWPAQISQPAQNFEKWTERGSTFHALVHSYLCNVPEEKIINTLQDQSLINWFNNFKIFISRYPNPRFIWPEKQLNALIDGFRFTAIFDAIFFFDDGKIVIFDWKTNQKYPPSHVIKETIQSILYPCILTRNLKMIGKKCGQKTKSMEMIYWFSEYPERQINLAIHEEQNKKNEKRLVDLAQQIYQKETGQFIKTEHLQNCRFCQYRSLCNRGIRAFDTTIIENDPLIDSAIFNLSMDEINSIEL